jgi:hypothetical protein
MDRPAREKWSWPAKVTRSSRVLFGARVATGARRRKSRHSQGMGKKRRGFFHDGAQLSASGASAIALVALSRLGGHPGLAPAVRRQGSADIVDQIVSHCSEPSISQANAATALMLRLEAQEDHAALSLKDPTRRRRARGRARGHRPDRKACRRHSRRSRRRRLFARCRASRPSAPGPRAAGPWPRACRPGAAGDAPGHRCCGSRAKPSSRPGSAVGWPPTTANASAETTPAKRRRSGD